MILHTHLFVKTSFFFPFSSSKDKQEHVLHVQVGLNCFSTYSLYLLLLFFSCQDENGWYTKMSENQWLKGQSKHARWVGKVTVTVPLKYCLQLSQRKFCQQSMCLTLDLGKEMCKYFSSDSSKVSASWFPVQLFSLTNIFIRPNSSTNIFLLRI